MPIFEYACRDCGKEFETLVRASTTPECPHCHSQALDKLLSVPGAVGVSSSAAATLPPGCGSCGHPEGPGACQRH